MERNEVKYDTYLLPYTKINSRWVVDFQIASECGKSFSTSLVIRKMHMKSTGYQYTAMRMVNM